MTDVAETPGAGLVIPEWVATLMGRRELEHEIARAHLLAQVTQLSAQVEQLTIDLNSIADRLAKAEERAVLATLDPNGRNARKPGRGDVA